MTSKLDPSRNYSYCAIVAFFGFLAFMAQPTAYTWGEQDMMPFFERVFDDNYLLNDFFTNSAMVINPRWVYGYFIVAFSWVSGLSWYTALYVSKLLLSIVNPILYFKLSCLLVGKYVSRAKMSYLAPLIVLAVLSMVYIKDYREYFTIASWLNYTQAMQANSISLVFCFCAIILKEKQAKPFIYLLLFALGCLVHPSVGLYGALFYILFLIPKYKEERYAILRILITCILAIILVKLVFSNSGNLSTAEFIKYYVLDRHPWHYHVPYYKVQSKDWIETFLTINLLFLVPLCYAALRRNKNLIILAALCLFFYAGAIAAQYVFVDLYPVKLLVYLGTSRFTSFAYWMLLPLWIILLADVIKGNGYFVFPNLSLKNFSFIVINLIFVGIVFLDSPKADKYEEKKDFYDFISSTPEDAIFITHLTRLNTDLRIIGRRGVLVGLEFPFTENAIKEYNNRFSRVYGSKQEEQNGISFYRKLMPTDFLDIAENYQLDYIVTEKRFSSPFKSYEPIWSNNEFEIYEVKNLRF